MNTSPCNVHQLISAASYNTLIWMTCWQFQDILLVEHNAFNYIFEPSEVILVLCLLGRHYGGRQEQILTQ